MLDDSDINQIIEDGELNTETVKLLKIVSTKGYDYYPDEINNPIFGMNGTNEPAEVPFVGTAPWLESRPEISWIYWQMEAEHYNPTQADWQSDTDLSGVDATVYVHVDDISEIIELDVPREFVEE